MNPGAGEVGNAAAQSNPGSWLSQLLQAFLNFYKNLLNELATFLQNPVGTLQQIITAFATNPVAALLAYGPLLLFAAYEVISPIATYGPMLAALPLILSLALSSVTVPLGEIAAVRAGCGAGRRRSATGLRVRRVSRYGRWPAWPRRWRVPQRLRPLRLPRVPVRLPRRHRQRLLGVSPTWWVVAVIQEPASGRR